MTNHLVTGHVTTLKSRTLNAFDSVSTTAIGGVIAPATGITAPPIAGARSLWFKPSGHGAGHRP